MEAAEEGGRPGEEGGRRPAAEGAGRRASAAREEWSAGGVVVRRLGKEPHFLLIRDPYWNWGLPKGHVEGDEAPEETALREVREETGLADVAIEADLGVIDWRFRFDGSDIHKHCRFFLMTSTRGVPVPEVAEGITECRWLPVEEAIRGVTYDNAREVLRSAARVLEKEHGAAGDGRERVAGAEDREGPAGPDGPEPPDTRGLPDGMERP